MTYPVNDNERPNERRAERRHRVLLSGKLTWLNNPFSSDCTIRDLSDGGARIRLTDPLAQVDPVLIVMRTGQAYASRTAWRRGDLVGLEFRESYDLTQRGDMPLAGARQLWVDHLPRPYI